MDTIKKEEINRHRRYFVGAAAVTAAAAQFGIVGSAKAQSSTTRQVQLPPIKPGANTSFAPLKQIDAGVLNIGYAEAGPAKRAPGHSSPRLAVRHLTALSMSLRCWHRPGIA